MPRDFFGEGGREETEKDEEDIEKEENEREKKGEMVSE